MAAKYSHSPAAERAFQALSTMCAARTGAPKGSRCEPLVGYLVFSGIRKLAKTGSRYVVPSNEIGMMLESVLVEDGALNPVLVDYVQENLTKYADNDIPIIKVDNLLKYVSPDAMPESARNALRTISGFANADTDETFPCRRMLARAAGVADLDRWDRIVAELEKHGWISKIPQFRIPGRGYVAVKPCPKGTVIPPGNVQRFVTWDGKLLPLGSEQTTNIYTVHPERGEWWTEADAAEKKRANEAKRAKRAAKVVPVAAVEAPAAADAAPAPAPAPAVTVPEPKDAPVEKPAPAPAPAPATPSSKKYVQEDTAAARAAFNAALNAATPVAPASTSATPWAPSTAARNLAASKGIDVDALVASFALSQGHRFSDPSQRHRLDDSFYQATMMQSVALASEARRNRRAAEASAEASF